MQRRSNGKLSYTLGAVNVWSKGLLQPLTGYLGLTLVSVWNSAMREKSNFCFSTVFC